MSDTYIGPFGRLLPIEYRPNSPQEEDNQNLPSRRHFTMAAAPASAPRLPLPVRLQFGTDPGPSFSDPHRYETAPKHDNRPSHSASRSRSMHEKLPPVSHLLTPTSQGPGGSPGLQKVGLNYSREPYNGPSSPHGSSHSDSFSRHEPTYIPSYNNGSYDYNNNYRVNSHHSLSGYSEANPHVSVAIPSYHAPSDIRPDMGPAYNSSPLPGLRHLNHLPEGSQSPYDQQPHRSELRTVPQPVKKVIREEDVPGEGPCYIYDDGSRVQKVIDGETVNAHWGVTKAGKPRKRLAIACITCREKKIKCEPAEPKCVQCDKSGRDCRFQTAVRNQLKEARVSSYEQQAHTPKALKCQKDVCVEPAKPTAGLTVLSGSSQTSGTPLEQSNRKRVASISRDSKPVDVTKKIRPSFEEKGPSQLYPNLADFKIFSTKHERPFSETKLNSLSDPFISHPIATLHYVDRYFTKFNAGRYHIFPRNTFMRWLANSKHKTPEDLMVLYSMLAVGSMYSERDDAKSTGALFYDLATEEVAKSLGNFSIQGVQSRLLLSFYCFGVADYSVGWELSGTALRVALALRMHLEVPDSEDEEVVPFDFPAPVLTECYRRTFWNCFIFDRFQAFCLEHVLVIQKEDIFLRLPCDDISYDRNLINKMPYFDNNIVGEDGYFTEKVSSEVSPMAFLIKIMSLAGEILQYAHRSSYRSPSTYTSEYEDFHHDLTKRLYAWRQTLPRYFQLSPVNMENSITEGYGDTYTTAHAMFHLSLVILNCRVRRQLLSFESIHRNTKTALSESAQILSLLDMLLDTEVNLESHSSKHRTELPDKQLESAIDGFSSGLLVPFVGHAAFYAVDVVSCAGPCDRDFIGELVDKLTVALRVSEKLVSYYPIVKYQCKQIRKRLLALQNISKSTPAEGAAWRFRSCLQNTRADELTLFYGENASQLVLDIVGVQVKPEAIATI